MVDLLLERYGWTDEYVESLDFEKFDGLIKLVAKKRVQKQEHDERVRQAELLTLSRATTFGLQANNDLPPSKQESKRKKPDWTKIEKVRKSMMSMMEDWNKALSHPWHFAKYMGLHPVYDQPQEEVQTTRRLKTRQDVESMRDRMLNQLIALRDTYGGDADLRDIGKQAPPPQVEEPDEVVEVASQADLARELRRP